ncbi:NEAT domain-containing protein [Paenibacillus polymyxa]|uniref:NEAT domain-containing protein n=1 Tax=Paenibacillus polymyxa TaxID=1406 RepID=UPI002ED488B1|nr:NEAT domain-containing protein [Paenibacillus polymyxa]
MKRQFKKYLMTFVAIIMLLSVVFPFAPTASASDETNPSIESSVSESSVTQDVYTVEPSPVEVIPTEDVASTYTVAAVETPSSSIMQDSNVYSINYVVKNESKASGVGISPYNDMFLKPATFTVEQDTYHVSLILDNPNTPFTDIEFKQNGENVPAHISDLVKGDKTYEPRTVTFDVYNLDQKIDVNYIYNNRLRQNWIEFDPSTIAVKEGSVTPPTPSPEPEVPLKPGVLNFTILKDKSEEVSVMDGYALKPAKLVQKGDKWYIQLTFNYSSWIPSFQTEQNGKFVEAATISEVSDANQRTVEFEVNNLSNSLNAYTHVIVPGLELGGVPYDHWYHVQIKFDTSITPDPSTPPTLADGTYAINFNTLHATKDQPSTMAQYLLSPATLTVAKGQKEVSFTIKDSTTVTEFKTEQNGTLTDADIVSEDKTANTRVVKFKVADLDAILNAQVHVSTTYPGGVYEMDHKLRLQFDKNSITENGSSPETTSNLDFTLLKDGTNEVSMMDGYTEKPGTLIERNGKKYVRFTLKKSEQIDGFKVEQNGVLTNVATVSEDKTANTRVIEFEVKEIPAKLSAWVSINWPELGYVHTYNVDLQLASAPTSPSLADGTYAINFNTLHATKDQPSAMAQYLLSPATLTVAKGQKEVSFTIKDSTTVTEFKTEQNGTLTDADIVSEDKTANTRVVKFKVADLDAILNAQVHVSTTYPGGVYEMDHKLRLLFDKNSITNAPTPVDPGTPGTPGTPGKNLADGTYSINFDALHATKDQKSAMAQYLLSPATLTVSKGKYEASFTIKDSTTVTEFKTEQNGTLTDADIVSEDKNANTRVVKFKVANLDAILNAQVHVSTTYPGGVYEMDHKLRLQFDRSSVTAKGPDNGTTTPVENGRYSIDFSVLKNGSNEISVMDGYMQKPATLLKQSGKNIIQIKMDKSSWIKTFKVNGSEAQVVEQSTSADTRTVQFEVPNLSDKVTVNTHVIVPGLDLGGIPYDHVYDVQFQFEPATIRSFVEPTSSGAADPIVKLDFDKLANGKYALKFTIVLPDGITGSESPAQRFITNEPAQLVVEGDKRFVGLKLQNSNEVKALRIWDNASGGYQDAEVTREDAVSNTKDVRFSVSDFKNNVKGQLVVYEAPKVASSAPMVFKAEDRVEKVYDFEFKFDTSNVSYPNETKADEVEQGKNNLDDGEYTANFRVLANGTDKDSLVAPFVQSLAKLIVKNGKVQAHVTVTDNQALKLFQTDFEGRYANPTIVGTDTKGDTHTIAFEVPDLDKKLSVYTQVYLPEKYIFNEKFGGQIQFDRASLKGEGVNAATTATATESAAASTDKATETTTSVAEAKPAVEQPVQPASEKQYTINYNVFKDKTNEASVMDGYLDKPATLIEKGDKRYIQITLKNSSWMPTLQVEQNGTLKDVEVISTSGDTRIVQFEVGDLSQKISAYTHVIVPGLVLGGVPYDHWYMVQFQFDEASLKVK